MQSTRFWAVALFAVFVSASSASCDDDEDSLQPTCTDCAGAGGHGDGAGFAGVAVSSSGSSTLPNGGAAAGTSSAGATGDAGAGRQGGQGGVGSGGAAGEAGAGASTAGEQLELCTRLAHGAQDADTVASAYIGAVYRDCRVSWVVPRGQALADLVNQLVSFSYNLWGCERTLPVDEFGLVLGTPALSQGDVTLLIGHYLAAAQKTLALSLDEREAMEAALLRLSKLLILDVSVEPSKSVCLVEGGAGGAGGAAAGGAAAGGAGGSL